MADLVQHPLIQALAWALVNFLWQGAVIGLAAYVAFRAAQSAGVRYAIGVGALAAMLVAPVVTFAVVLGQSASQPTPGLAATSGVIESRAAVAAVSDAGAAVNAGPRVSPELLALAVLGWVAGVVFFSIRLLGGWIVARRMARRAVQPAAEHIQQMARRLADRLAIDRVVVVLQSASVAVPVMVGWLKPTIVLPLAALSGLTPAQVEALVAHELAHVRRHDYLVNLLQSAVEALLFFHPAAWWLSRRVRAERELCCDDLAVSVCDRLVYATALSDLATMVSPRVALAATDGNLLIRVRRILGAGEGSDMGRVHWMPAVVLGLAATLIVPVAIIAATTQPSGPAQTFAAVLADEGAVQSAGSAPQQSAEARRQAAEDMRRQEELLRAKMAEIERELALLARRSAELRIDEHFGSKEQSAEWLKALRMFETQQHLSKGNAEDAAKMYELHKKSFEQAAAEHDRQMKLDTGKYEEMRKLYEKGLASRNQLHDAETLMAQAGGDVAAQHAAQVNRLAEQLARMKELADRGLVSKSEFEALQHKLAELSQLGHLAVQDKLAKAAQAEMAAHNAQMRAAEVHAALQEQHAKLTQEQRAKVVQELQKKELNAEIIEKVKQVLEKSKAELEKSVRFKVLETAIGEKEPARAGDVLRITISGEPDLPSRFTIAESGSIRIPFLGSFKVAGQTGTQIRDAIGQQLESRKLGNTSQVQVTVLRPGKGEAAKQVK